MVLLITSCLTGGVAVNLSEWFESSHLSNSPVIRLIAMAPTSMRSLLHEAGVQDPIIEHIWNLEITTVALFSRFGNSETEIRERITEPYFATLPEQPIPLLVRVLNEATVLSAWDDAKQVRASPAAPSLPGTQMAPEVPAPVAPYSANHSMLSTTLRVAEQVEKFESSWSPRRTFPVKTVLGAE